MYITGQKILTTGRNSATAGAADSRRQAMVAASKHTNKELGSMWTVYCDMATSLRSNYSWQQRPHLSNSKAHQTPATNSTGHLTPGHASTTESSTRARGLTQEGIKDQGNHPAVTDAPAAAAAEAAKLGGRGAPNK